LRAAVVLLLTLFPYAESPAQAQDAPVPAIAWKVCPENAKVQCGTFRVPADWANPAGPTVMLTVARRPATDPAQRIGALFVNPGGPGGSAVDFTFDAPTFFTEQLRKHFDIVGLDPRGVGRSTPVLCSQDLIDARPTPLIEPEPALQNRLCCAFARLDLVAAVSARKNRVVARVPDLRIDAV